MNVDTNDDNDHGAVSIPTMLDDDDLATTILHLSARLKVFATNIKC
jgi:hypothetical protein